MIVCDIGTNLMWSLDDVAPRTCCEDSTLDEILQDYFGDISPLCLCFTLLLLYGQRTNAGISIVMATFPIVYVALYYFIPLNYYVIILFLLNFIPLNYYYLL